MQAHGYSFLREKGMFVYCFVQPQNRVRLEVPAAPAAWGAGLFCHQNPFIPGWQAQSCSPGMQGIKLAARGQQRLRNNAGHGCAGALGKPVLATA